MPRRRFRLDRAVLGATIGAAVGIGLLQLLLHYFVTTGNYYAGAVLLGSGLGAAASLKLWRDCDQPVAQALAGGLVALAAILFGWWQLRLPLFDRLWALALVAVLISLTVGFIARQKQLDR
jgi:hypothetical protein